MAGASRLRLGHLIVSPCIARAQGDDVLLYWRELERKFRELQPADNDGLRAIFYKPSDHWQLQEAPSNSVLRQFKNLAGWAAQKLHKGPEWQSFLNELKSQPDTAVLLNTTLSRLPSGQEVLGQVWAIDRVCEAAADFCQTRLPEDQSEARKRKLFEPILGPLDVFETTSHPKEELLEPVKQQNPPLSAQIGALRRECRLTVEELAEKIRVDRRTVQRHEAGVSIPHLRHLAAYERVFGNILKRRVSLKEMP